MDWRRLGSVARTALALLALLLVLLLADALCYRATLPVTLDVTAGSAALTAGGERFALGAVGTPAALQIPAHDLVVHEYQLDGTDSTNNLTLDSAYLDRIAPSPYYRFQAWMRDLDGTSAWRDVRIVADGRLTTATSTPANGAQWSLPQARSLHITLQLQRPETPRSFTLVTTTGDLITVTLDRNAHRITVIRDGTDVPSAAPLVLAFFPVDTTPFAAMVLDFVVRVLFWATLLALLVMVIDLYAALARGALLRPLGRSLGGLPRATTDSASIQRLRSARDAATSAVNAWWAAVTTRAALATRWRGGVVRMLAGRWRALTAALHPVALVALVGSLFVTSWIARVQFAGAPHIYDASAYLFMAKVYAAGHLWATHPPAADRFPGPFMGTAAGKWFAQYVPGTSAVLALGLKLGAVWLVEPVLGTLALLGIGLIAARLFDRRTATVAVLLGALSPFYSYLAASYLSHTVALFFLVWGFWALLRFVQGGAGWNLPLATALFGAAEMTRELVPLLFAAIVVVGVVAISWRDQNAALRDPRRWGAPLFAAVVVVFIFVLAGREFNAALTGDPALTPRGLLNPSDHVGFGPGIGFYGQHTPAAGFVTLDELLTSLAIDLYGWPFYLALAPLLVPFVLRRARPADWLLLAGASIISAAFIGLFYHGIYLGPRYLYETLPFLLILTARGLLMLGTLGAETAAAAARWSSRLGLAGAPPDATKHAAPARSLAAPLLALALVACGLVYYWPRQLALHTNFTALPATDVVNLTRVYTPPFHHAIIVTGDYQLYGYTLFALNDPQFQDDVLYAYGSDVADYAELHQAFPGRALYVLEVATSGAVSYAPAP
ncbi:MAG: glycosyltransferase family 39 protein [Ktedonobacterales bacterium]